MHVIAF